jgi:predicted unusual protein kinase regulating ubiquinone biosynthesis (AarF/ABC1/UbiB family)
MTIFLLIKHKERFLFFQPLSPEALKIQINELGASFIKLAQVLATRADLSQVLATRADLFDDVYLEELRSLHDEIPPMSSDDFQKVYRSAFLDEEPFKRFERTPIASASIGEVHEAWLKSGEHVAVKLRRYGTYFFQPYFQTALFTLYQKLHGCTDR